MNDDPTADPFAAKTERIYRLRSLSDEYGRKGVEDAILRNEIFWSSPSNFNDPMDCRPNLIFGKTQEDRENWINTAIANQLGSLPRPDRRRTKKDMLKKPAEHHAQLARRSFERFMGESAVCCFSRRADSLLMWAHYGDCHRGVNLVFEEQFDPKRGLSQFVAHNVVYTEERPEVDVTRFGGNTDAMVASVLTKAQDWSYENEKRMLDYRRPQGPRSFPSSAFKGVIFGARTSEDDKQWVRDLAIQAEKSLLFWQAHLSDTEFRLQLSEC